MQRRLIKKGSADRLSSQAQNRKLKTGSSAPVDVRPRSLEEGIGAEVKRLRKSLDLTDENWYRQVSAERSRSPDLCA